MNRPAGNVEPNALFGRPRGNDEALQFAEPDGAGGLLAALADCGVSKLLHSGFLFGIFVLFVFFCECERTPLFVPQINTLLNIEFELHARFWP